MTKASSHSSSRHLPNSIYWLAGIVCVASILFFTNFKSNTVSTATANSGPANFWAEAIAYEGKGDWAQAILSFRHYLEANGPDKTAFRHLAELCVKTGQFNQALAYAQQDVQAAPDAAEAVFKLGVVYQLLGQTKEAAQSYQKSVELDPKYAEGYFNLGFLSETQGQYLDAVAHYKNAIEADPKHAKAYYNLGNVYAAMEKDGDAVGAYEAAVANNPDYMDALVNLAILMTKNGKYKEAIQYLDEARILGYEPPEEFLNALEVYREKKAATP